MAPGARKFECFECGRKWDEPYGTGRPTSCPSCWSRNIHRAAEDRGRMGGARCFQTPGRRRGGG